MATLPNDTEALVCPAGLDQAGNLAHQVILSVLTQYRATHCGGCKAFYSPAEWRAREEQYGIESKLIVVYDGGDLVPFFSLDADYPNYRLHTRMSEALKKAGFYVEECTNWYAAVYPVRV